MQVLQTIGGTVLTISGFGLGVIPSAGFYSVTVGETACSGVEVRAPGRPPPL